MTSGKKKKDGADELRGKAEQKASQLLPPEELSPVEVQRLVRELRVHQIEIEMQNDALREAQAELVESNCRITDLYDFAPVGYLSLDEKSVILEANLTVGKQLGIGRGVLVGRPFPNFIAPDERAGFCSHVARIFRDRSQQAFETRLIAKEEGNELYALLECMFVEDARGKKQCRISVTDISDRRRAEEAVKVYMKKLERSNIELENFAFVASHDMQEPLRKIQTFGSIIERRYTGAFPHEAQDYLDRMMKAAKRMSDMIEGLLEYSRVGTRIKPFETVDLTPMVREVERDLEILVGKSGARIEVGRLPILEADPDQMRRLFQNIIGNALKFREKKEPRPVVKIHAESAGDGIGPASGGKAHRIFVEDNGIGFDEKDADGIFALFNRLHGKGAYEGTGMGLAICRRIVDRHHGTITATGKAGHGATFVITLPERQPAED